MQRPENSAAPPTKRRRQLTSNKDNDHSPESTYSPLVFAGTSSSLETQEA